MKKEQYSGGDIVPLPRHSENFKVNRMISYIEKHWNSTIELEELASWAGSSSCYASALFSRTMCMTFIQYLNALRVNKASRLLLDSSMTIKEISDFCGFQNSSYFIHIFHSLSGSTPGEYRKTCLQHISGQLRGRRNQRVRRQHYRGRLIILQYAPLYMQNKGGSQIIQTHRIAF